MGGIVCKRFVTVDLAKTEPRLNVNKDETLGQSVEGGKESCVNKDEKEFRPTKFMKLSDEKAIWTVTTTRHDPPNAFSPDGKELLVSGHKCVQIFNVENGICRLKVPVESLAQQTCVSWLTDDLFAIGFESCGCKRCHCDSAIYIYRKNGTFYAKLDHQTSFATSQVVSSNDGKYIAVRLSSSVAFFETPDYSNLNNSLDGVGLPPLHTLKLERGFDICDIRAFNRRFRILASFSPNDSSATDGREFYVYDTIMDHTFYLTTVLRVPCEQWLLRGAFSNDGNSFVVCSTEWLTADIREKSGRKYAATRYREHILDGKNVMTTFCNIFAIPSDDNKKQTMTDNKNVENVEKVETWIEHNDQAQLNNKSLLASGYGNVEYWPSIHNQDHSSVWTFSDGKYGSHCAAILSPDGKFIAVNHANHISMFKTRP